MNNEYALQIENSLDYWFENKVITESVYMKLMSKLGFALRAERKNLLDELDQLVNLANEEYEVGISIRDLRAWINEKRGS